MKFVLFLAVVLFCQAIEPCEGGKLFDFFHNFLARRAATIVNRFVRRERARESFRSFFRDIIEARLYANGRIGWNETVTVPPSTTPQITTPLSELNYWKNVSFLFSFFLLIFRLLVNFFRQVFLCIIKFGRTITSLLKAATEKYPADPSVIPATIGELHELEETLVWRWVGFICRKK